jgi:hypothetical protein
VGAVFLGFLTVVVLSVGTDQVLHVLGVYPPWGQTMFDPGLNLLALAYRITFTVAGGYVAASVAPANAMRHALILGIIGTAAGLAGAIITIPMHMGPAWYPIALVVTALPCSWLGGTLFVKRHAERQPTSNH